MKLTIKVSPPSSTGRQCSVPVATYMLGSKLINLLIFHKCSSFGALIVNMLNLVFKVTICAYIITVIN